MKLYWTRLFEKESHNLGIHSYKSFRINIFFQSAKDSENDFEEEKYDDGR